MKNKAHTLSGTIGRIGCIAAAAALAVFFLIAGDRTVNAPAETTVPPQIPWIIGPDHFGSYGELMFAYIGENNLLYNLDDESLPLTQDPASELLYASDDSVLYLSPCETNTSQSGREHLIRELQVGEKENLLNTIATVSMHPCWSGNDEVIYFVRDQDLQTLCTFEPLTSTTEEAAHFEQPVKGLRISSDGLLVTQESGEELLYVPLSKTLTEPLVNCQGMAIQVCEQYDLVLSPQGELFYHWQGSPVLTQVSTNVTAAISHQDNELFYLKETDAGITLCSYIVSEESESTLAELPEEMLPQLTADDSMALMLSRTGRIYLYDIAAQEVRPVCTLDLFSVRSPLISLFDYRLMVYDLSREPDQTFCWARSLDTLENLPADTPLSSPLLLSMGDCGEPVTTLQLQLADGGWLTGGASAFYDVPTLWAVRHAQSALGTEDSGSVTAEFMELLSTASAATEETLRGVQVLDVQARLRTLGYLASPLSGVWDAQTEQIMAQLRAGHEDLNINEVLAAAQPSASPLPLVLGSTGEQALRLNHRLYDLKYMAALPDATVTEATLQACQLFLACQESTLSVSESIDGTVQSMILDEHAGDCPENMRPERTAGTSSANPGQVITDKELKVLRKWLTKSFAVNHTDRQAVKRLQRKLLRLGYIQEPQVTMIYDQDTADAVRAFQTASGIPSDGIPTKRTLMQLFGLTNMQLTGE